MAAGLAVLPALMGCQSYAPRPLEPDARYAAFLERTADAAEVAAFAEKLREEGRGGAFDASDGLELAEAEMVALLLNAELRVMRLRAGVTRVSAEKAGLWDDPVLEADFGRILQSVAEPWLLMTRVGLTLPVSGRLEVEKRRAGAEHAAMLARVAQAEWERVSELRVAWLEWSAAAQRREVLGDLVGRLDELVGIVAAIEGAGEMARLEATLFRAEQAMRRAELKRAENLVREREQGVLRLMGLPPGASVELRPALVVDVELEEGMEPARERSPGLAVALAEYEVAERRLELEIRRQYPDVQIGPGYGQEDGHDRLLLGVSLPIPLVNRNQQGIAVATAEREVAAAVFDAALEGLAAEVEVARIRLDSARTDREALEREIVPLIERQFADARLVAQLGEVNVLVLLETLTRQQEAKLALVEARLAEAVAGARLAELVGPPPRRNLEEAVQQ